MNKTITVLATAASMWIAPAWAASGGDSAQEVLALERQAMNGWLRGDPDPQLAILDPQITYFHDVVRVRLEGLPAVRELYERYRGVALFDSYEIRNPKVQAIGEVAVLTYQLSQRKGAAAKLWNGTQVYRRTTEGWRVVHAHWSEAKEQRP